MSEKWLKSQIVWLKIKNKKIKLKTQTPNVDAQTKHTLIIDLFDYCYMFAISIISFSIIKSCGDFVNFY